VKCQLTDRNYDRSTVQHSVGRFEKNTLLKARVVPLARHLELRGMKRAGFCKERQVVPAVKSAR
jgi:hypothetical protein